jgi:hypothetical protein
VVEVNRFAPSTNILKYWPWVHRYPSSVNTIDL